MAIKSLKKKVFVSSAICPQKNDLFIFFYSKSRAGAEIKKHIGTATSTDINTPKEYRYRTQ